MVTKSCESDIFNHTPFFPTGFLVCSKALFKLSHIVALHKSIVLHLLMYRVLLRNNPMRRFKFTLLVMYVLVS